MHGGAGIVRRIPQWIAVRAADLFIKYSPIVGIVLYREANWKLSGRLDSRVNIISSGCIDLGKSQTRRWCVEPRVSAYVSKSHI